MIVPCTAPGRGWQWMRPYEMLHDPSAWNCATGPRLVRKKFQPQRSLGLLACVRGWEKRKGPVFTSLPPTLSHSELTCATSKQVTSPEKCRTKMIMQFVSWMSKTAAMMRRSTLHIQYFPHNRESYNQWLFGQSCCRKSTTLRLLQGQTTRWHNTADINMMKTTCPNRFFHPTHAHAEASKLAEQVKQETTLHLP